MKTAVQLSNDIVEESFFEDTKLLSIVAPMNDYRFIWYVNTLLDYDFRSKPELAIHLHKKKIVRKKTAEMDFFFSVFEYSKPSIALTEYIYHNQNKGESLLPDYKHIDFLWLLKGDHSDDEYINDLKVLLRTIPNVQLVTDIPIENVKKRDNLII